MFKIICTFAVLAIASVQFVKADFTAHALEHYFINDANVPEKSLLANAQEYVKWIEIAHDAPTGQLIVFPEYGLTGIVTEKPELYAIEVGNINEVLPVNDVLTLLSNSAKVNQIYVVVNLIEKDSSGSKTFYYNTNVVFGKNGLIVAKYRKINLNGVEQKIFTAGTQPSSFLTDTGMSFGLITSDDLIFDYPTKTLLTHNVPNIICTTAWQSSTPFLNGLSLQAGYAKANGVNLIAASLIAPVVGRSGSGIYSRNGTNLKTYVSGSTTRFPLKAVIGSGGAVENECGTVQPSKVPTEISARGIPRPDGTLSDLGSYAIKRSINPTAFKHKKLDFSQNLNIEGKICSGDNCCNYNVEAASATEENYKIFVFNGKQSIQNRTRHVRVCALVACESDSVESCGTKITTTRNTLFNNITLVANFENRVNSSYLPVTLTSTTLSPLAKIQYCKETVNNKISVRVASGHNEQVANLLTFGVFSTSSAPLFGVSLIVLVWAAIAKVIVQ